VVVTGRNGGMVLSFSTIFFFSQSSQLVLFCGTMAAKNSAGCKNVNGLVVTHCSAMG